MANMVEACIHVPAAVTWTDATGGSVPRVPRSVRVGSRERVQNVVGRPGMLMRALLRSMARRTEDPARVVAEYAGHSAGRRRGARLSPHEQFLRSRRFGALDGLRAISVLAVVWHHTAGTQFSGLLGQGALGVHMFFAISGFLITTLLLRERSRVGSISLR